MFILFVKNTIHLEVKSSDIKRNWWLCEVHAMVLC